MTMNINLTKITPKQAAQMLAKNTGNRRLDPKRVRKYASEMARGQWKVTGDTIKLADDGRVLDGQHRLAAIAEAGSTVTVAVATGVDADVFDVLDSGKTRTSGDVLKIAGIKSASVTATVARMLILLDAGIDPNDSHSGSVVSKTDILEFAVKNEAALLDAVQRGNILYNRVGGNWSAWATFCFLTSAVDPEGLGEFVDGVVTGIGLSHGDPRLGLRNYLAQRKPTDRVMSTTTYQRAYNAWAQNRKMSRIKPVEAGELPPEPVMRVKRARKAVAA
jgi:hypothetical protein